MRKIEIIGEDIVLIQGLALSRSDSLFAAVDAVTKRAPYRHMMTPWGKRMSVAISNCGKVGWVSDRSGYRYCANDPLSGEPWPAMPPIFSSLAKAAAKIAGHAHFSPDVALINRYAAGDRMGLHQDKDEDDFKNPIVSISLGASARFCIGGLRRSDKVTKIALCHGDVLVWGGASRLIFHGIDRVFEVPDASLPKHRINITLRRAR